MQSSRFLILSALVITALSASSGISAQREPVGPALGFTQNASGTTIWPIIGVPGAAAFGDRIPFDAAIHGAVISSAKDYALAVRDDDGTVVVLSLKGEYSLTPVPGTSVNPELMAISPMGSAAAVYIAGSQSIQIIRGLPQAPEILQEFSVSAVGGRLASLALSDDGAIALVNFITNEEGRTELWVLDASGPRAFGTEGSTVPAFFPDRHDAIVADDATQTVYVVTNLDQEAARVGVLSTADGLEVLSSVSVTGDGRAALIGDSRTGTIAIVNLETRQPVLLNCDCKLAGFSRLQRNSMFQLTPLSAEPVTIMDTSPGEARVFIIPPIPAERRVQP